MNTENERDVVWDFIKTNKLAVMATIAAEKNAPEAALVYYTSDKDHKIFIATAKDSRKLRNIEAHKHVALVIKHDSEATVLQLEGTAKIITDKSIQANLLEEIAKVSNSDERSSYFPPIISLSSATHMEFVEITITWLKYSNFETHFPFIIEGTPENAKKHLVSK